MLDRLQTMWDQVDERDSDLWGRVSDRYSPHYVRRPVSPIRWNEFPGAVLLDLPPYQQVNDYSCGFVAGLTALHHYYPGKSPKAFLRRTGLTYDGLHRTSLVRALRASGVVVNVRTDLKFDDIRAAIDAEQPVLAEVQRPESDVEHWIAIGGYQARPHFIFLWNWRLYSALPKPIRWQEFASVWKPRGLGLICRKKE